MQKIRLRLVRQHAPWLVAAAVFGVCAWLTAWQEPEHEQQAFVLALLFCTFGMLLFAFGRVAIALVLSGGLFLALKSLSVLKLRYLDSPLEAADFIYYVRTSLWDTVRRYPHLLGLGITLILVVPPLLWLIWRWDLRVFPRVRRGVRLLLRAAGVAVFALFFEFCLWPAGPFAAVHARGVWEKLSDDAQLTNFFVNINDERVSMPAMSDDATAAAAWQGSTAGRPGVRPAPYPDIVQVLEESTFDPADFDACTVPYCHVAMLGVDANTRGHGMLRVHTFGGGTWVSEFAALTGMPHDIFGPGGSYAPFVLAPHVHDSLPLQLKRLGYLTVAIYPTNGAFLNGRNAYQFYGVDHMYDAIQLKMDEWEQSDTQMFQAAKQVYDQLTRDGTRKPGQPVFMMILTINQHGPHNIDPRPTLPPPFNHPVLQGLDTASAFNFDTYLARLRDSDTGMQLLEHDFLQRSQPTLLVHFGDHQPSFDGLIRPLQRHLPDGLRPYQDYLTYYTVKTNFPTAPLPSYPMLDIAYLPGMVLQAAGLPEDAYFTANTMLRDRCNGLYMDCPLTDLIKSYHGWIFGHLHVYQ